MSREVREYEITYAIKQFLLQKNWDVIAYNPPGSQGTFTIPNPTKDGSYRGQSGSESPDIIALKNCQILIVECKPGFDSDDVDKLRNLSKNKEKLAILDCLIEKVCLANEIKYDEKGKYHFALAYSGANMNLNDIGFLKVELDPNFDVTTIVAKESYREHFDTKIYPASAWEESFNALFEN